MNKISVVKGNERRENIWLAIKLLERDIDRAITDKKINRLFIKINAIDTNFPIACTHPDALTAVLDIFYNRFDEIVVGDNTFVFTKDNGGIYRGVLKNYPKVRLSGLTEFGAEEIDFRTLDGIRKGKISLLPKNAFTISLALPKTHDTFVYTGCLKNMFGCVIENKGHLHATRLYERLIVGKYVRSNSLKWENLVNVINRVKPDLSILDAYEGMEGEGPLLGTSIHMGLAMCSLDGVSLDKTASKICGIEHVPYLKMLPDSESKIIKKGFNDFLEVGKKFNLHYKHRYQIAESFNSFLPRIDLRFVLSVLKRPHRIKDKLFEKIGI